MNPISPVSESERLLKLARAARLERSRSAAAAIEPADRSRPLALSFSQQRLWFLEQLGGMGSTYHVRRRLRLRGTLDRRALVRALDRVVARHEALRTTFRAVDGAPEQRVAPAEDSAFHLLEHDLRGRDGAEDELARLIAEEAEAPFDLARGPLIRGRLLRMAEDDHVLLLTMHHIVSDAWSMGVLVDELSTLYAAFTRGEHDPLPPLPVQYADYAAWQRTWVDGEVLRAQADYWTKALAGAPELLELPADRPRPARQDHAGGQVAVRFDEALTAALRELSRRHGATLHMTLLAGWAVVLGRLAGEDDVVVGTPSANRGREEISRLVGFFLNTLAIRVDLSGSPTVAGLLARVRERALEAQANQDIPFEQVVERVQPERSLAHNPVFQAMFTWQNAPRGTLELPGLALEPLAGTSRPAAKVDLALSLQEEEGRIAGAVTYAAALFDAATVERFAGYLRRALEAMAADDGRRVGEIEILSADERARVVSEWNRTDAEYPAALCLHELFEAQAARTPDAAAVVYEGGSVTYAELNARANRLAHHLIHRGAGPDVCVGLCLERGLEMVEGVLAVLKAGGAYVALDPDYPGERLRYMLADSAPAALLAHASLTERFAGMGVPVIAVDRDAADWSDRPETNPDRGTLTPDHLVYVIYTSGSTGWPKGVMNTHRNVVNRVGGIQRAWELEPGESVLQNASLSFDVSAYEIFWPLMTGARVVMTRPDGHKDPGYLVETIRTYEIGTASFVPSSLQLFLEHPDVDRCTSLRRVPCGGEALPAALVRRLAERLPNARLYNRYGPSEAATAVTGWIRAAEEMRASVPIGRPLPNARVYVLSRGGEPVPVGVAGELYIGGAGVGRGYLDRPEMTAERFVADPFSAEPGARLYRTGDLARWLPDGTVEFLGRDDFQVKVRGLRVELGEIEARLAEHAHVREAVVLAREHAPGDQRLVAYYAASSAIEVESLRAHLLERLPEYMVPAAYVHLDAMPLTPSGKLDRAALPAPEGGAYARRGYEAPATEMEAALAAVWSEVLGVGDVGRWDHFFELGGHSLLAVRVISRVRQVIGADAALGRLFERPVLADFARGLAEGGRAELPPIEPADRDERLPLSFAQQRLWFLERLGNLGSTYHVRRRLRLRGELSRAALVRALDRIVARHEALRTTFVDVDGRPEQRIASIEESRFHLAEHDLAGRADADAELRRIASEEAEARFDLERGPLFRGRLVRMAEDDHVLLLTMHHVVSDAWSMGLLVHELGALYGAFARGEGDPLPPLAVQYADYAAWQRRWVDGEVLEAQGAYWTRALSGAPELLEIPTDRPRPARQDFAGASLSVELGEELPEALKALSQRHGTTLFMTLLAGWSVVLGRLSGQADVVIGTPSANRGRREVERLIGFFLNSLPIRVDLSGAPSVAELLRRARGRALEAQSNQDIPFEQVVERVSPARSLAHPPVFQVLFAWQNAPRQPLELPGLAPAPVDVPAPVGTAKFDLTLSLSETAGRVTGRVEYATALFDAATIERHVGYLRRVLEAMAADEDARVDRLPMLSDAERAQVVEGWNATDAEYPSALCVHELVESQVERTPDAAAIEFDGETLTFAEVNRRANRLAHFLAEHGVGPDVRVGLCLERGPEMVIGLLAVLKAGGAYVPLDPGYPEDRLRYYLEDSAPAALLTHSSLRDRFDGVEIPVFSLDADDSMWADRSDANPERGGLTPDHLMYVMYTSGSTGRPKGVMVGHRAVVNRIVWMQASHGLVAGDAMLQKTTFAFDVSVWEIFWPIAVGARVTLARPEGHRDPAYLVETVRGAGVTDMHFVPSMLPLFLEHPGAAECTGLRRVYCSGEALPPSLVRRFRELLPGVELHNWYGPTEGGEVSYWRCAPGELTDVVPIGFPIANTRLYVLDAGGQPVPQGVAGELFIGGVALARGYWNRPALTAERFVPDPFGAPGARLYRTGDLCRWMPDGAVEYLGRNDFQVKIRGFRVELGDIEARLVEHPEVREAAVVARDEGPGDRRLVAYYVADRAASIEALRAHLGETLPEYMVPAAFVHLAAWPLTPTGKLDRKALPAPGGSAYARRGYEAPVTETEAALAGIWAELLGLERVGRHDHFFELGGHSLLAVQVGSRVRQSLGVEVALGTLFERPGLADFARALAAAARTELPPIELVDRGGMLALSFAQQRLWFLEQLGGMGSSYHVQKRMRLKGALDADALARALDRLVARHETLRTTFVVIGGEPVQRIAPPEASRFALVRHDLAGDADADARLRRVLADEVTEPFDLESGPPIRGRLVRLADHDHVLVLTMHHIVADAWSMGVLVHELGVLYAAFRDGEPDPLPPLALQYADYAAWQRRWVDGAVLETQAAYWTDALSGAPDLLELPTDRPRPAQQDIAGASVGVMLDEALTAELKALGQRHGTTPFMILLAAWATVLGRLAGQRDVVIGTPTANRGHREIEGLIGFFVNTLALRVNLSDSPTVAGLLARVKARAVEAQANQDIPFEEVVERVQPERSLAHTPVFQVLFAWQSVSQGSLELSGVELTPVQGVLSGTSKYDMVLSLQEAGGRIVGRVEYATALFEASTIQRFVGYLRRVLEEMAADDARPVDQLPMLPEAERRQVVETWNATDAAFPSDSCLHELIEAQADRNPNVIALSFDGGALTYAELNARSNRLALHLVARGVGPDVRVGISVERGPEMVIAFLAVLKAGGAYVPLDPSYPEDRLRYMLADSAPAVLLTDSSLAHRFESTGVPVVALDADSASWSSESGANPGRNGLTPDHLAYVIYTSGSTGLPKGVMVAHRGVCNLVEAQTRTLGVEPGSRVLQFASFSFDACVFEIAMALCQGVSLHLPSPGVVLAGEALAEIVDRDAITHVTLPPAVLAPLSDDVRLASVRTMVLAGDVVTEALARRWAGGRRMFNAYGPTEATVWATLQRCREDEEGNPSIGGPIANARVYVLDRAGEPVPVGVAGELYIGGAGVARGYLNRPELTAERFVADPFSAEPGARLYRTGDLARWRADGTLDFIGRTDHQVKVRGYRIELGEIEARLAEHPSVREAVVIAREDGNLAAEKRLVAYVVGDSIDAEALSAHLAGHLPEYMVPAAYVRLDSLPLTPNGKLDRKALPAPEGESFARGGYEAPVGAGEETLAELWAALLGVERVGRHDHFFELGGHSLLAFRLIEQMRQRGLHAEVRTLFTTPRLAELAAAVRSDSLEVAVPTTVIPVGCDAITPDMLPLVELTQAEIDRVVAVVPGGAPNVQDIYPLAPLQEGMLFHHLMTSEGDPYLSTMVSSFDTRERMEAYLAAMQAVVARHDILRTSVVWQGLREPVQVVWREARLEVEEVEVDSAGGDVARRLHARFDPRRHRIDLGRAPLLKGYAAYDVGRNAWILLLLRHHLVLDHTTHEVVQQEVQAHMRGMEDQLPAPLPFRNYMVQARLSMTREENEAYFRALLGDVEEPTAPFGLVDAWGDGSGIEEGRLQLDVGLSARLRERARALGVSAASVCHVAWARVLASASGRGDVVFGTVLFGRMKGGEGSDRVMGPFINTLPVRVRAGSQGVEESVLETHTQLAELMRHEHASLALAQRCSAVEASAPLFTSLLNYRHIGGVWRARTAEEADAARGGGRVLHAEDRTNYPVTLSVNDRDTGLSLQAQVPASVGAERVCAMMRRALEGVVEALERAPARPLARLDVLPEAERARVVREWNASEAEFPAHACIHELFQAQAEEHPRAVALVCKGESLTYAELNARANRLAHHLASRGVGPDVRVGVSVERRPEMVVALLAVLKAGGAYVPLDPTYPEDRLRHMLSDSAPAVLLTQASLAGRFAEMEVPVVALDADASAWSDQPETNPERGGLTSNHLAYLIYTSGSTGLPKGVAIEHRQAVNFVAWGARSFEGKGLDRTLLSTSLNFDLAVFETFVPLATGAAVHLVRDALELLDVSPDVTLINTVPSAIAALVEAGRVPASVRTINLAGEPLKRGLAEKIFATTNVERLCNLYGPTETTTYSTWVEMRRAGGFVPHIGRPVANTQIYVLGRTGEPAPAGVIGELFIAGDGVARGYLNRPAMTAERFVPDPFSTEPGARMYRTGDLARWLSGGNVEFLGRNDAQVKVRGFRIELGEIEARLAEHAAVREAVVVAREDGPGEKRLVAYVVPEWEEVDAAAALAEAEASAAEEAESLEAEHEGDWRTAWQLTYGADAPAADPTFDITGWNSSYTGEAIPPEEMREWVEATVARIRSLAPKRVLEMGCGTGLLLARVAPHCERYVGADFSARAVGGIERLRETRPELAHVEAMERTADDFAGFEDGAFDAVVLNSVAQYLPSLEYLSRVLEGAARVVRPGGHVFVGDIRDLRLLGAFHTAIETFRAPPTRETGEWKERAEQAQAQEEELVIDPAFFWSLGEAIPAICRVETLAKRGRARNELTEFRYDVVLHVGGAPADASIEENRIDWDVSRLTLHVLRAWLESAEGDALVVQEIPNARVSGALKQLEIRRDPREVASVGEVRRRTADAGGVDPDALWTLGEALGWRVEVRLADSGDAGRVDARFTRAPDGGARRPFPARQPAVRRELAAYSTDPLRGRRTGKLVRQLRAHLAAQLPEHMVPAAYVALEAMPRTPNGKVDRKALPTSEGDTHARRGYEAPSGGKERALAELWMEVLGVERVGRHDNFFELGGHSLLAVRLLERMRRRGLHADVQALLATPTLAGMAAAAGDEPVGVAVPANLIPAPAAAAPAPGAETVELVL